MLYETTHWLCKGKIVEILECDEDVWKVRNVITGETEYLHYGWLREYIKNKGEYSYAF